MVIVHELTPFHLAASHGHFEICQYIINNIDNKNPGGWTPLHEAAKKGFFTIVKLIIDNVTEKNPSDRNGHTPLHMSAMNGHLDICQLISVEIIENNPKVSRKSLLSTVLAHLEADCLEATIFVSSHN